MTLVLDLLLQDSNLTSQVMLVPTLVMASTTTTHMDSITQEAEQHTALGMASGVEWEPEDCWDIFLGARETSRTTMDTPLSITADPPPAETPPHPLGPELPQVLEEPKEDKSCEMD